MHMHTHEIKIRVLPVSEASVGGQDYLKSGHNLDYSGMHRSVHDRSEYIRLCPLLR
jgi:hypothetical protein